MGISNEEFLFLSEEEKYKVLKENNIKIHPLLWMLLSDYLKNSIHTIYWIATERVESDPPGAITHEDGKKIIERCDQLKKSLTKMQNELLQAKED